MCFYRYLKIKKQKNKNNLQISNNIHFTAHLINLHWMIYFHNILYCVSFFYFCKTNFTDENNVYESVTKNKKKLKKDKATSKYIRGAIKMCVLWKVHLILKLVCSSKMLTESETSPVNPTLALKDPAKNLWIAVFKYTITSESN